MLRGVSRGLLGAIAIAMVSIAMVYGGASEAAAASGKRFVTIGTAGATSNYLAVGRAICDLLPEEITCAAPATGGSTFNIDQLAKGGFDFGIVQSDWQYHAHKRTAPDLVKPFEGLRAVFSLYPEPVQVVVAGKSEVRRFQDLKGKRVNIGNPGSGQRATMAVLMEAYGITRDDFGAATELTSVEQSGALCDEEIDAFVFSTMAPDPRIALAADTCGARILPLDTAVERKLVSDQPYFDAVTLPEGTYATMSQGVTTFGVLATLVTRATADEETVYALVRAVMENIESFRSATPALRNLDPKAMAAEGLWAPLHPGALRYYEEQGWVED